MLMFRCPNACILPLGCEVFTKKTGPFISPLTTFGWRGRGERVGNVVGCHFPAVLSLSRSPVVTSEPSVRDSVVAKDLGNES